MQVGGVSHGWGASRLWHDPNYEVSRDYRPIAVQKGIETGEALPKEEHLEPPERPGDPYKMQESAYDVAAAQMTRGVEAQAFLHGQKPNPLAFDAAVAAAREKLVGEDVTRTQVAQPMNLSQPAPGAVVQPQEVQPHAPGTVTHAQGTTTSSSEKEAAQAAKQAKDVSEVVDAAALAVGGVMSATVSAKALTAAQAVGAATQATSAIAAATTGGTVAAGGVQIGTHTDEPIDAVTRDPKQQR